MSVEAAGLAAGKAVAQRAFRVWLAGRSARAERNAELTELIKTRFTDQFFAARRLENQIEGIANSVGERLVQLCGPEFGELTNTDRAAALAEVTATLTAADLSDSALLQADMDPIQLAQQIRDAMPNQRMELQLGEAGSRLHEAVLAECCACLVAIVQQLPQFGPRATTEMLTRLTSLSEQVRAVLDRLPKRTLDAPAGTSIDEEFQQRYLRYISETQDRIELFGIPVKRYRPETTLSVAYISLSVSSGDRTARPQRQRRRPISALRSDWHTDSYEQDGTTMPVETALSQSPRILLRGEAGSGKSTVLHWLAVSAARGRFTGDLSPWNGYVPFLIKLRAYADRPLPTPENFLQGTADPISGLMPPAWVHRKLSSGRAILMIDGVDELVGPQRRKVREWLSRHLAAYPKVCVVVTSRPTAAGADWLAGERFASAFLERMSPADVRSLIAHWHRAVRDHPALPCPADELPRFESALLARLQSSPDLRNLASTPLLAAMLCALNLDRRTQLPRSRMPLYAAALEMLLERRDEQRGIRPAAGLESHQQQRILQDLAWRLSQRGRSEMPKEAATQWVADKLAAMPGVTETPAVVVDELLQRTGVLREPVRGRIDFIHRTMQEYLTAKQAADHDDFEPLLDNAHLDQWRETIIMAAGHANAPQRDELLSGLLHRATTDSRHSRKLKLLIAGCLETVEEIPSRLADQISACLNDLIPPRDQATARSLATAGMSILDRMPTNLDQFSEPVAAATVHAVAMINGQIALDLMEGYRTDARHAVVRELAEAWDYFDARDYARRVLSGTRLGKAGSTYLLTAANSGQLAALTELGGVERVQITFNPGDLRSLAAFADTLTELHLYPLQRGAVDMTPLAALHKLDYLRIVVNEAHELDFLTRLSRLTSLSLTFRSASEDLAPIARLSDLTYLDLAGYRELNVPELLGPLHRLQSLHLHSNSTISGGLAALVDTLPQLSSLTVAHSPWLDDLSPLASLSLGYLALFHSAAVEDLAPLATQASLEDLYLDHTSVRDLAPLVGLSKLETVSLTGCSHVSDLSPLAALPRLRYLDIGEMQPGIDVAPLAGLRHLSVEADKHQEIRNAHLLGRRLHRR